MADSLAFTPKISLGAYYQLLFAKRGFGLAPHHYPIIAGLEDLRIDNLLIMGPPGIGKALAPDAKVLTPYGWLDIDKITPGFPVMGAHGKFVNVLARVDVPSSMLKRITFKDGRQVVCHKNHLWRVRSRWYTAGDTWSVITTDEIEKNTILAKNKEAAPHHRNGFIQLADPADSQDTELPLPPYLLGCILGDGSISKTGSVSFTSMDPEIVERMRRGAEAAGLEIVDRKSDGRCPLYGINGVFRRMRSLGLVGHRAWEKFIPEMYFSASRAQREALLQGLTDTDGHATRGGRCEFVTVSKQLCADIRRLIWSLGGTARVVEKNPVFTVKGKKIIGKLAYRMYFRLADPNRMFYLPRKLKYAKSGKDVYAHALRIEKVENAYESRSVCIQVDSPDGLFITDNYIVTHNSTLLSTVFATWMIGHDPTITTLAISAGEALPQGFMSTAMQIIQHNPIFHELFPTVKPDPEQGWSLQRGLFVTGHEQTDPDATYKAVGVSSKALTGLHARLHIYDDLHDKENAYTPESRAQVVHTYYTTLMGRADPRGSRFVAAGRWWAEDDIYQEWIRNGDWVVMQLPAERPGSMRLWYDVSVPKGMTNVFTETLDLEENQDPNSSYIRYRAYYAAVDATKKGFYWPGSKLKRREYETVARRQPRTAAVNYRGDMTGGGEGIFHEDDFKPYLPPPDMDLGIQSPHVKAWATALKGEIEEAWDTALGQPQSTSLTTALTGLLVPCKSWHCGEDASLVGECDFHYDVYLLDLMAKDLDFRELAMALRQRYGLWHPRRVIVEEKQSGVSLLQTFKGTHIPVYGQKVEQGKMERAVNPVLSQEGGLPIPGGAASVQGWARMGRVRVPAGAAWLTEPHGDATVGFLSRVCAFTGGSKAADEFDALVHLVTRAIMRSRQVAYMPGLSEREQVGTAAPYGYEDPRQAVMEAFQGLAQQARDPSSQHNPFEGVCGTCSAHAVELNTEFCRKHTRKVSVFEGCGDWSQKI